ncbi:transposase [Lysinibacter sp. HNR]|uniref:transposase n=1 Tax=Lysinibacter sp. HNR TaxID=3031408 RepID=UPI002435F9D3|nr:transposase [Lysinibacter sp. HNR]WGD37602.1 transposase [Lysinibacter sp. HNR]
MLTEIGPVKIDVPRDREASFKPMIAPERKRCLGGTCEMVLSLTVRGLTTERHKRISKRWVWCTFR